jgi:hypothetical protein
LAAAGIEPVWRVGHVTDPLGFVPREHVSWAGRFDDPAREFRTLYVAERPETALRETLAPLRPDAAAIVALRDVVGADSDAERALGLVSLSELSRRALASGRLEASRPLLDLTDYSMRAATAAHHAAILAAFGVPHLDETDLRSRRREFTQARGIGMRRAGLDAGRLRRVDRCRVR